MWEYISIHGLSGNILDKLNELGADGWEMTVVFQDHFYFKRPIKPAPKKRPPRQKADK